jgi:hypothetical protein
MNGKVTDLKEPVNPMGGFSSSRHEKLFSQSVVLKPLPAHENIRQQLIHFLAVGACQMILSRGGVSRLHPHSVAWKHYASTGCLTAEIRGKRKISKDVNQISHPFYD